MPNNGAPRLLNEGRPLACSVRALRVGSWPPLRFLRRAACGSSPTAVEVRAALGAYFARLCGRTRDELRLVLDARDVYRLDYPSEAFRVLRDKELRTGADYRTRRQVLDAEALDLLHSGALR